MAVRTASKHNRYCSPVIPAQGPGGLASGGREPMVFNAMQLPRMGLMNSLPLYPSTKAHLNIGIITGLTETTNPDGSTPVQEPAGCCDDYPQAGLTTMCEWCSPWGQFGRQSRVFSLCDDDAYCDMPMEVIGSVLNARREASGRGRGRRGRNGRGRRNARQERRFMGNDLGRGQGIQYPNGMIINERNILNSTYDKAMFELAATFQRDMSPWYFSGNPKASGGGVFRPFKGLASIINTGYRDAPSQAPCPAADSIVVDIKDALGVDKICENASGAVNIISQLVSNSKQLSHDFGLGITDGVFIGPSWMRDGLIRMWVCGYGGCTCCGEAMDNKSMGGVVMHTMTSEATQMRDEMMRESFIVVDGMEIPWIVDNSDDYSSFDKETGVRTGRLFYTPITAMNGAFPIFYQQYRPWNTGAIRQAIQGWAPDGFFNPQASRDGSWLLFKKPPDNLCLQIAGTTKRRLAHHAPYLAFQVKGISFCTFVAPRTYDVGRTEGPLPDDCDGIPGPEGGADLSGGGVDVVANPDLSKAFCIKLKNDEGVAESTTIYLQPDGCYVQANGCVVDIGDACPDEGVCPPSDSATQWCYNPWYGDSQSVWQQPDGSYTAMEDGASDVVDVSGGTVCEGSCPVAYEPAPYCVNPHNGDPFAVWMQEDGGFLDGAGEAFSPNDVACDLVAGACPLPPEAGPVAWCHTVGEVDTTIYSLDGVWYSDAEATVAYTGNVMEGMLVEGACAAGRVAGATAAKSTEAKKAATPKPASKGKSKKDSK